MGKIREEDIDIKFVTPVPVFGEVHIAYTYKGHFEIITVPETASAEEVMKLIKEDIIHKKLPRRLETSQRLKEELERMKRR